jgi:spore coat protein A, manganese oxidase
MATRPQANLLNLPHATGSTKRGSFPHAPLYRLAAQQLRHQFHRDLGGGFPGPVIRAASGSPVYVEWRNGLPGGSHPLWAPDFARAHGPGIGGTPADARRIVTHLHGLKCPADSDGWPEEIILPGQSARLPCFYPNDQEAATRWYHDHALGITRLNVYMGLAGFYLLSDAWEQSLPLPRGVYDLPLAIMDRSFNADGSLAYPMVLAPEVFSDHITVNGKVSPYAPVARGKYRLRLLNGCTARFLVLKLSSGVAFHQIASEQGLLPRPVAMI